MPGGLQTSYLYFKLKIKSQKEYLAIHNPHFDLIEVLNLSTFNLQKAGESVLTSKCSHKNRFPVFKIEKGKTYLIKVKRNGPGYFPLLLFNHDDYMLYNVKNDLLLGFVVTVLILSLIYSLILFLKLKESLYLKYILYLLPVIHVLLLIEGAAYRYIYGNFQGLTYYAEAIGVNFMTLGFVYFSSAVLKMKEYSPKIYLVNRFIFGLVVALIISILFIDRPVFLFFTQIIPLLVIILAAVAAIKAIRGGLLSVKFYLWGWSIFLIGVFIRSLMNLGVIPYNTYLLYFSYIALVLECLLFMLTIVNRMKYEHLKVMNLKKENIIFKDRIDELTGLGSEVDGEHSFDIFSEREQDVFKLIIKGMKNKEIADTLFISNNTVKYHLSNIYAKIDVRSKSEAVSWYLSQVKQS